MATMMLLAVAVAALATASSAALATASSASPSEDAPYVFPRSHMDQSTCLTLAEYGGIHGTVTVAAAKQNSQALRDAMGAAAQSTTARCVLIQAGEQYAIFATEMDSIANVTLFLQGDLVVPDTDLTMKAWPFGAVGGQKLDPVLLFQSCTDIAITGKGTIYGQGFRWWSAFLLGRLDKKRPNLVVFMDSKRLLIEDITFDNSPKFNLYMQASDVEVSGVTIHVDWEKQQELTLNAHAAQGRSVDLPFDRMIMPPFNTDGIDFAGQRLYVHDIVAENFDDVVALKPGNMAGTGCTEDVLVERAAVTSGVGMSIGSVAPQEGTNCVRNVVFRDIAFERPFKAIYIKSKCRQYSTDDYCSLDDGDALIQNITYKNIVIAGARQWPVYVGPQQQKEPNGVGDGIWPPANPLVSIKDIFFENVTSTDGFPPRGGLLRCADENPCGPIHMDGVTLVESNDLHNGWIFNAAFGDEAAGAATVPSLPDEFFA